LTDKDLPEAAWDSANLNIALDWASATFRSVAACASIIRPRSMRLIDSEQRDPVDPITRLAKCCTRLLERDPLTCAVAVAAHGAFLSSISGSAAASTKPATADGRSFARGGGEFACDLLSGRAPTPQ
jgi:hypothetical protein